MTLEEAAGIVGVAPFTVNPERQKLVAAQSSAREDWIEAHLDSYDSTRAHAADLAYDLEESAERIAKALLSAPVASRYAAQDAFDCIADALETGYEIFQTTFALVKWDMRNAR